MADALTALDGTFLELEELDDGALMSIGGVMVFDPLPNGGVPSIADVHARLAPRLQSLPRYSHRLSTPHVRGLSWPQWVPDEEFDLRWHVRHAALPAPGTDAQLCDLAAELFSHALDRKRPLWELVLIEGLEGGRWALAQKTHHCLVDGVGSVDVLDLLLDDTPDATEADGLVAAPDHRSAARRLSFRPPDSIAQAAHAYTQAAGASLHAARHPRQALVRSRALVEMIAADELSGAPRTSLNVPIGQRRRFGVVRVPLAELKAIGGELGGSINDVVLAACASGLRRLLVARGEELPPAVRAMVPMNLRDSSGQLALGNRVTSLFVDLPIASPDVRGRLAEIASSTKRLKRTGGAVGAMTLTELAALVPPAVVRAALARTSFATRLFNVTITNVPGPQRPLYGLGARLREVHPLVPLAADHSVGIAAFSYNGLLTFGINADAAATPDLEVLAYGVEEGVEELLALLPHPPNEQQERSTWQYV